MKTKSIVRKRHKRGAGMSLLEQSDFLSCGSFSGDKVAGYFANVEVGQIYLQIGEDSIDRLIAGLQCSKEAIQRYRQGIDKLF